MSQVARPLTGAIENPFSAALIPSSLVQLRWIAAAGQMLGLLVVRYSMQLPLPVVPLALLMGLSISSNLMLRGWLSRRRSGPAHLSGMVLFLDTLVLTGLLYLSGGPTNPFSVLYLVHITLAAVMLGPGWTWVITSLSSLSFGVLFLLPVPPALHLGQHNHGGEFSSHLQGMWVAFTLAAVLTSYFVSRLSAELRKRDEQLMLARDEAALNARLASLTTLAAGAAHELGTPLGTIAIVARELEIAAAKLEGDAARAIVDDVRLVRGQLDRCRSILDQMSAQAGEAGNGPPAHLPCESVVHEALAVLSSEQRRRVVVASEPQASQALLPADAVITVLRNLVKNALDASALSATPSGDGPLQADQGTAGAGQVNISIVRLDARIVLEVRDRGHGMPGDVLARAIEPFFSTRPPGKGLGLGLFLAHTLTAQIGGTLKLESLPGVGTIARLEVPIAGSQGGSE